MKQKLLFTAAAIVIFSIAGYFLVRKIESGAFEKDLIPAFTQPGSDWKNINGPLIESEWRQDSVFAYFSPGNELLGCWSVAFAQVLAYHKLQPRGRVIYTTSNGISVDEEFIPAVWEKIVPVIDTATSAASITETARYCYYAAIVLQKDFGRGEYKNVSIIPEEVSEHFGCLISKHDTPVDSTIRMEIAADRPVIAYFNDILSIRIVTNGHAAVLDGTAELNNKLMVHVNFGWGGKSDGWYNLETLASDRKLKYVFTVSK